MTKSREELSASGKSAQYILLDGNYVLIRDAINHRIVRAYGTLGTDWSDAWLAAAFLGLGYFFCLRVDAWAQTGQWLAIAAFSTAGFFAVHAFRNKGKRR